MSTGVLEEGVLLTGLAGEARRQPAKHPSVVANRTLIWRVRLEDPMMRCRSITVVRPMRDPYATTVPRLDSPSLRRRDHDACRNLTVTSTTTKRASGTANLQGGDRQEDEAHVDVEQHQDRQRIDSGMHRRRRNSRKGIRTEVVRSGAVLDVDVDKLKGVVDKETEDAVGVRLRGGQQRTDADRMHRHGMCLRRPPTCHRDQETCRQHPPTSRV